MTAPARLLLTALAVLAVAATAGCRDDSPSQTDVNRQVAAPSCPTLPERLNNGLLSDNPGEPEFRAARHQAQVVLGQDPVRIDLLAGATAPSGKTPVVASVSTPDLGQARVCDGRWLTYTPEPEGGMQGQVRIRYCLAGSQALDGCASVELETVAQSSVELMNKVKEHDLPTVPYILTTQAERDTMRKAGMSSDGLLRYQSYNDAFWAKAINFGNDFPARIAIAAQCGGIAGAIGEEYNVIAKSLEFVGEGFARIDVELAALSSGTAPDTAVTAGEDAKILASSLFDMADVVRNAQLGVDEYGKAAMKSGLVLDAATGKYVAHPVSEFCQAVGGVIAPELGRRTAGQ